MDFESAIRAQQVIDNKVEWPKLTVGHIIGAVLAIHDPADAKEFRDSYLEWQRKQDSGRHTPEEVVCANIGWCFGEGMPQKDVEMWAALGMSHPVFGATRPTAQEAFKAGFARGSAARK